MKKEFVHYSRDGITVLCEAPDFVAYTNDREIMKLSLSKGRRVQEGGKRVPVKKELSITPVTG